MRQKRLVIIGTAEGQKQLYVKAKQKGLYTIAFSYNRGCIPSELIEKYSKTANEIFENRIPTNYEEIRNALDQNREKFFDELANI